jgi:hypothetical protein
MGTQSERGAMSTRKEQRKRSKARRKRRQAGRCSECNWARNSAYPDPCLGWLSGVCHACCGHGGGEAVPYVVFDEVGKHDPVAARSLRQCAPSIIPDALYGSEALAYFRALSVGPSCVQLPLFPEDSRYVP